MLGIALLTAQPIDGAVTMPTDQPFVTPEGEASSSTDPESYRTLIETSHHIDRCLETLIEDWRNNRMSDESTQPVLSELRTLFTKQTEAVLSIQRETREEFGQKIDGLTTRIDARFAAYEQRISEIELSRAKEAGRAEGQGDIIGRINAIDDKIQPAIDAAVQQIRTEMTKEIEDLRKVNAEQSKVIDDFKLWRAKIIGGAGVLSLLGGSGGALLMQLFGG